MPGKKRSKAGGSADFWSNIEGWKAVEVGDEFFMAGDEYGFMGLEELDPSTVGASIKVLTLPP